ncbi:hypothetical protein F1C16_04715 [Hymenobacter sp. NBH84]|uniref:Cardiolipin synthase N-terminal domain-containing protein n=1 Tax=Hymenobacter defluvii TaxID=2054411 RepID=A0ABS3T911_9BACT|nr:MULTISPECIES: hypothetical protein [Hymenobacter]MBO3269265.1 hypothetical protein [Hymenobacter defluvii]QNE38908.1 hypothetical protein F1C16_04715 [Hymenobacter sp. NBH84]
MALLIPFMMLLLVLWVLPFCGWLVALVRRRLAGKPLTAWGVVAFWGSLLPIIYLGYWALLI